MSFSEAIKTCFSKYATFSGRATRSEYWYFFLFNFLVSFVLSFLGNFSSIKLFEVLGYLFMLATFIPTLAVAWRRLHDIGRSGAWWFILLIPLIGWILLLVWLCQSSQMQPNDYGPVPSVGSGTQTIG